MRSSSRTKFRDWYELILEEAEQKSVTRAVETLELLGPTLRYPLSSGISQSRYSHMRELRIQHFGKPYRVLYAFDPRRVAFLLLGGDKTGNSRWYEEMISKADAYYDRHLKQIAKEEESASDNRRDK